MAKGVVLENTAYTYEKNDNFEFQPEIKKIKNKN
jgi:hypothetical protein